jgi:hypothetical protein
VQVHVCVCVYVACCVCRLCVLVGHLVQWPVITSVQSRFRCVKGGSTLAGSTASVRVDAWSLEPGWKYG